MIQTFSQIESARRDLVHTQADNLALDRLSTLFYALPRPSTFPIEAWRNVLTAWAYAPRCTIQGTWAVIDAMFRPFTRGLTLIDAEVFTALDAHNMIITHQDLDTTHSQRLAIIEKDGEETLVFLPFGASGLAGVCRYSSAYWSGYNELGKLNLTPLPYFIEERPAEIILWLDHVLLSAPPTYMQNAPDPRPLNQPLGGILLNLFDLDPATLDFGNQETGAFPLYLQDDDLNGVFGHILKRTIPAGVRLSVRAHRWSTIDSQISLSDLLNRGET